MENFSAGNPAGNQSPFRGFPWFVFHRVACDEKCASGLDVEGIVITFSGHTALVVEGDIYNVDHCLAVFIGTVAADKRGID